jgi:AraC-like DNA-binding protein
MRLRFVQPHPRLKGLINKMWVFESDGRAPVEDMKLIVPNGMVKLTIPYRNGVSGRNKDGYRLVKESSIIIIGICDTPAIVDLEHDAPHGNIGIEFSPTGAYRLFRVRQAELKNRIFLIEEILGKSAKEMQEAIANTGEVDGKIRMIQQYLIKLMSGSEADPLLDYCVREIECSKGLMTVGELERRTGYSSRWLYDKFVEKVGLSPKNLSSVVRFMQFYKQWAKDPGLGFYKDDIYDFFYDQAHFIKDFKRFTGLSPLKFVRSDNEFGRIFWKG